MRLALAALAALLLAPAAAQAGTYTVSSCGGAPNLAWEAVVPESGYLEATDECATAGGLAVRERLGGRGLPRSGEAAWWRFTAPPGTAVAAVELTGSMRIYLDPAWSPQLWAGGEAPLQTCTFGGFWEDECSVGGTLAYALPVPAPEVRMGAVCDPAGLAGGCDRGSRLHSVDVVLQAATVTVDDPTPPVVTATRADGIVTVDASDGAGIAARQVLVDGVPVLDRTAACDPAYAAPCGGTRGLDGPIATPIGPGEHVIVATATDAAGNVTTIEVP